MLVRRENTEQVRDKNMLLWKFASQLGLYSSGSSSAVQSCRYLQVLSTLFG